MTLSRRTVLLSLASVMTAAQKSNAAGPTVVVSKDPNCDCCRAWAEHLRTSGFAVELRDVTDLGAVKTRLGVPSDLAACHTAEVGGYVIEGHVPASDVQRLLKERPKIVGLAAPGMPPSAPGMDQPGKTPYDVLAFDAKGNTTVWAKH